MLRTPPGPWASGYRGPFGGPPGGDVSAGLLRKGRVMRELPRTLDSHPGPATRPAAALQVATGLRRHLQHLPCDRDCQRTDASIAPIFGPDRPWERRHRPGKETFTVVVIVIRTCLKLFKRWAPWSGVAHSFSACLAARDAVWCVHSLLCANMRAHTSPQQQSAHAACASAPVV